MIRAYAVAIGLAAWLPGAAQAAERLAPLPYAKITSRAQHGKTIDVSGHLSVLGEVATLEGSLAGKAILVDLSNLSREDRGTVRGKCLPGCDVRVTGLSGSVLREVGLIATGLAVADQDGSSKLASAK